MIYCNNPSTENVKEKAFRSSDKEKVQHIANVIRKEIDAIKGAFSNWPPPSDELTNASVIPPLLQLLLRTLITTKSSVSDRVDRLINSIGQDIFYSCSRGKIKTVKHTQLALVVKRKSGSKVMTNFLNRLGHCISC